MSDVELTVTGRPKRATRFPKKFLDEAPSMPIRRASRGTKRKLENDGDDPNHSLDFLLHDPNSVLTRMNISVRLLDP